MTDSDHEYTDAERAYARLGNISPEALRRQRATMQAERDRRKAEASRLIDSMKRFHTSYMRNDADATASGHNPLNAWNPPERDND